MRDDAEIIWRIRTQHTHHKQAWISWKVYRSVADWFFATGNLGIRICPHVHVQIPIWTIDAHVACELMYECPNN